MADEQATEHTPGPVHGHLGTGPGEDGVARLMNVDDDILADLRQHSTANAPANLRRIVACWNAHDELLEALEEIAKGEGRYSRDQLTHCTNTVEDMKAIARAAIAAAQPKHAAQEGEAG